MDKGVQGHGISMMAVKWLGWWKVDPGRESYRVESLPLAGTLEGRHPTPTILQSVSSEVGVPENPDDSNLGKQLGAVWR